MKKKILWLSDSPLTNTGYATISRNILNGLSDEFECHYQSHNHPGQPLPPGITFKDGTKLNFWLYGSGREPYARDVLQRRINDIKPDFFCVLLDSFMLYPWILNMNFAPCTTVLYFPSDGEGGLPSDCDKVLRHFHKAVAMSKFAKNQCASVHNLDTDYIPHAVDTDLFRPLSDIEKEKARAGMEIISVNEARVKGFLKGKFVVGCVSRNQGRKMLDRGLRSFAKFCQGKPDAVFYIHTDPTDAAAVFDIRRLVQRLGIANRVVFSPMKFFENFEYKDMNKLYNCFDVFFLSTSGEGWGVPTIEAMSCEVPVIVTDYTTSKEIIKENGECGVAVPIATELTGSWNVDRGIMDVDKGAEALSMYYNNRDKIKEHGKVGREKVLKYYSWDVVIEMWKKFFGGTK